MVSISKVASLLGKGLSGTKKPVTNCLDRLGCESRPIFESTKAGKLFEPGQQDVVQITRSIPEIKFEQTPLKEKLIDEVIDHGTQKGTETIRLIKKDGTLADDLKVIESGHNCRLEGENVDAAKLSGIYIHNHPSKAPLSPGDVREFLRSKLAEMIAVSPDKSISCLLNTPAPKDPFVLHEAFERFLNAQRAKLKELGIQRGDSFTTKVVDNSHITPETWDDYYRFQEGNLRRFAQETGYGYYSKGFSESNLTPLTQDIVQFTKGVKPKSYEISPDLASRFEQVPQGRELFEQSYDEFWRLKGNTVLHDSSPNIDGNHLLHGIRGYDRTKISGILEDGIVTGDVRFKNKGFLSEDGETFGCADFFISPKPSTIKDYCTTYLNSRVGFRQVPERSFLPRHSETPAFASDNIAFVIDSTQLQRDSKVLLTNSATPSSLDSNNLKDIIHHFPGITNHRAVLMGIPSQYISKIIVGGKIKPAEILEIKAMLKANNLDAKIFDTQGVQL